MRAAHWVGSLAVRWAANSAETSVPRSAAKRAVLLAPTKVERWGQNWAAKRADLLAHHLVGSMVGQKVGHWAEHWAARKVVDSVEM